MKFTQKELRNPFYLNFDFWLCQLVLNDKFTPIPKRLIEPSRWRLVNNGSGNYSFVRVNKVNGYLTKNTVNLNNEGSEYSVFSSKDDCIKEFKSMLDREASRLDNHLSSYFTTYDKIDDLQRKLNNIK